MTTLSEIYRRYASEVYRFALGLSGNRAWAEDITAETFVRALVSPAPIRTETVRAYLFTIARNLYLQQRRKEQRVTSVDEALPDRAPGPDHIAENRDELRAVLDALQKLPEIDRAALLMYARDEVSHRAIASALGLSVAAVKVRIHRARVRLAELLKEQP